MTKENCEICGRFLADYETEANQDFKGTKKGDKVNIHGCLNCEIFTLG